MVTDFSLQQINKVAADFALLCKKHSIFAFEGEMGAGKTTFITAVCKALGVEDAISSPTFSIINEYEGHEGQLIYHMDLYRLHDEDEVKRAGVEESFYAGGICFIEWPRRAGSLLPEDTVWCNLRVSGADNRILTVNL